MQNAMLKIIGKLFETFSVTNCRKSVGHEYLLYELIRKRIVYCDSDIFSCLMRVLHYTPLTNKSSNWQFSSPDSWDYVIFYVYF